jgi:hypothetical protein
MQVDNDKKLEATDRVMKFSDVVSFKVAYPKDYAKAKHIKDGETIELHRLQGEDWEKRGLGKIIK